MFVSLMHLVYVLSLKAIDIHQDLQTSRSPESGDICTKFAESQSCTTSIQLGSPDCTSTATVPMAVTGVGSVGSVNW